MLELSQVVTDITAMSAEAAKRRTRVAMQLESALQQARLEPTAWQEAHAKIAGKKSAWLAAVCDETPPATVFSAPNSPPIRYTAIATDGSQIPLDRHAIAPCYLINVGEIVLHYGTGERPRLHSQATLHYKDDEIYSHSASGEPSPLSEKIIANRRLLAESEALARLIRENKDRYAIALVDDPLIVWTPQGESAMEQQRVILEFCRMLDAGQESKTPVAGYVSRPGGRDVIGTLRLMLCPEDCGHKTGDPCMELAHLTDAHLFSALLTNPGDRSPVFASAARELVHYPDAHKVRFFYLNAGGEIARVEIPAWVAEDRGLLSLVHRLCVDQARKGQGYPIALSEAHERAVVRGPERDAFFRLVENAYVRHRLPVQQTRKALSKRTRVL